MGVGVGVGLDVHASSSGTTTRNRPKVRCDITRPEASRVAICFHPLHPPTHSTTVFTTRSTRSTTCSAIAAAAPSEDIWTGIPHFGWLRLPAQPKRASSCVNAHLPLRRVRCFGSLPRSVNYRNSLTRFLRGQMARPGGTVEWTLPLEAGECPEVSAGLSQEFLGRDWRR